MSNVLVHGSSGFLGRHLVPVLKSQGHTVVESSSKSQFEIQEFDLIFHLAAHTQAGDWCLTHSGEQWLENQHINTNILGYWKRFSPKAKLIAIGSSCCYAPGSNLKEEDYMKGEPHESLYTYAMTKRMLYEGCRALNKQYGMKYLYLVPSTLYGPNYHTDGRQAHFIFDLIKKIIRGKELDEHVILWGNGQQIRDVICVTDFIDKMLRLNSIAENDIFNVSDYVASIANYAKDICSIVGYDYEKITYDRSRHVGSEIKALNTAKMQNLLGPVTSILGDKIKEIVNWYLETGAWK